jgi:hypothetical protein
MFVITHCVLLFVIVIVLLSQVTIDRRVVELPQAFLHTHIKREGSSLILENSEGLRVVCNSAYDVCSVIVSGWYFGKTGGLVKQLFQFVLPFNYVWPFDTDSYWSVYWWIVERDYQLSLWTLSKGTCLQNTQICP